MHVHLVKKTMRKGSYEMCNSVCIDLPNVNFRDEEGDRHLQEQRDRFTPYVVKYKEKLASENRDTEENLMVSSRQNY